jgi:hypothetical protein
MTMLYGVLYYENEYNLSWKAPRSTFKNKDIHTCSIFC